MGVGCGGSGVPIYSHPSLAGSLWVSRPPDRKELPAMQERFLLTTYQAKKYLAAYYRGSGNYLAELPTHNGVDEKIGIELEHPYRFFLVRELREKPAYSKKKISSSLRWKVYERDGFKCVKCGVQKDLTLDHVIPESKGGLSTFENLQTMCKSHNSSKGTAYEGVQ